MSDTRNSRNFKICGADFFRRLDARWFARGSPVTLASLRVLFGFLTVVQLLGWLANWETWFGERGLVPSAAADGWGGLDSSINLLRGVTDPRIEYAFFLFVLGAAICMTIGLFSRVSCILTWIGYLTLCNRNPYMLCGSDEGLRIMHFYLCLAVTGEAYSIDRWLKLRECPQLPERTVPLWPQRLIVFQTIVVYASGVWNKLLSGTWLDGSVLYYVFRVEEYQRFWIPDFLKQPPLVNYLGYGALALEIALCTLVLHPKLRTPILLGGLLLHLGIDYSLSIPLFSYTTTGMYLAFYRGEELARFFRLIRDSLSQLAAKTYGRREKVTIS